MKSVLTPVPTSTTTPVEINGDTPTMRLFALLEVIASKDQFFSLQGLAEETGTPKPTLHRMLQQLENAGLLERGADSRQYGTGVRLRKLPRTCCSTTPFMARATACCAPWSTRLARAAI